VTNIEELQGVIHQLHGGKATHLESVPITEMFRGQVVWDGVVEVFRLRGHPRTHKVYAWSHETDDPEQPRRHVTVLHIPPAISPRTAVQVAIVQEHKNAASQA
jgi:hypothetical protein